MKQKIKQKLLSFKGNVHKPRIKQYKKYEKDVVFENGDSYKGTWRNGEAHGEGIFVEKETGNTFEGT